MFKKLKYLKEQAFLKAKNANGELSTPIEINRKKVIKKFLGPDSDLQDYEPYEFHNKNFWRYEYLYHHSTINESIIHNRLSSCGEYLGENTSRSNTMFHIDTSENFFLNDEDKERFIDVGNFKIYRLYKFWGTTGIKRNVYYTELRKYVEDSIWKESHPFLEDLKNELVNFNACSFIAGYYSNNSDIPKHYIVLRLFCGSQA